MYGMAANEFRSKTPCIPIPRCVVTLAVAVPYCQAPVEYILIRPILIAVNTVAVPTGSLFSVRCRPAATELACVRICKFFSGKFSLTIGDHFCRVVGHLVDMRVSSNPLRKGYDQERVLGKIFWGSAIVFAELMCIRRYKNQFVT